MRILFIGDIVGRIGRQAVRKLLPAIKAEFEPDLIIANAENIAHGSGITPKTLSEIQEAGIDFFTSGNHVLDKTEVVELLNTTNPVLIRPANLPDNTPGRGYKIFEVGSRKVMVINLMGQVFVNAECSNPFKKLDEILSEVNTDQLSAIFVDFHAEVTSEKRALGHYADGRISVMVGTHTHVPTADQHITPQGTAYLTDAGMVGARDSIIGNAKESIIADFLNEGKSKKEIPENGLVDFNSVIIDIDPTTKKAIDIQRVDRTIEV